MNAARRTRSQLALPDFDLQQLGRSPLKDARTALRNNPPDSLLGTARAPANDDDPEMMPIPLLLPLAADKSPKRPFSPVGCASPTTKRARYDFDVDAGVEARPSSAHPKSHTASSVPYSPRSQTPLELRRAHSVPPPSSPIPYIDLTRVPRSPSKRAVLVRTPSARAEDVHVSANASAEFDSLPAIEVHPASIVLDTQPSVPSSPLTPTSDDGQPAEGAALVALPPLTPLPETPFHAAASSASLSYAPSSPSRPHPNPSMLTDIAERAPNPSQPQDQPVPPPFHQSDSNSPPPVTPAPPPASRLPRPKSTTKLSQPDWAALFAPVSPAKPVHSEQATQGPGQIDVKNGANESGAGKTEIAKGSTMSGRMTRSAAMRDRRGRLKEGIVVSPASGSVNSGGTPSPVKSSMPPAPTPAISRSTGKGKAKAADSDIGTIMRSVSGSSSALTEKTAEASSSSARAGSTVSRSTSMRGRTPSTASTTTSRVPTRPQSRPRTPISAQTQPQTESQKRSKTPTPSQRQSTATSTKTQSSAADASSHIRTPARLRSASVSASLASGSTSTATTSQADGLSKAQARGVITRSASSRSAITRSASVKPALAAPTTSTAAPSSLPSRVPSPTKPASTASIFPSRSAATSALIEGKLKATSALKPISTSALSPSRSLPSVVSAVPLASAHSTSSITSHTSLTSLAQALNKLNAPPPSKIERPRPNTSMGFNVGKDAERSKGGQVRDDIGLDSSANGRTNGSAEKEKDKEVINEGKGKHKQNPLSSQAQSDGHVEMHSSSSQQTKDPANFNSNEMPPPPPPGEPPRKRINLSSGVVTGRPRGTLGTSFARATASSAARAATLPPASTTTPTTPGRAKAGIVARTGGAFPRLSGGRMGASRVLLRASRAPLLPSVQGSPVKGGSVTGTEAGETMMEVDAEAKGDREDRMDGEDVRMADVQEGDIGKGKDKGKGKDREAANNSDTPTLLSAVDTESQASQSMPGLLKRDASRRASLASQFLAQLHTPTSTSTSALPRGATSPNKGKRTRSAVSPEGARSLPGRRATGGAASGSRVSTRRNDASGTTGGSEGSGRGKGVLAGVLEGCNVFVDVRTDDGDDAGGLFADMLADMGARIMTRVGPTCTHVVYKNGLMSTLTRYRLCKEPRPLVVGIAWVVECVERRERVDESRFLVNLEGVNVAGTSKRRRSKLPKQVLLSPEKPRRERDDTPNTPSEPASDGSSPAIECAVGASGSSRVLLPLERARKRQNVLNFKSS